MNIVFDDEKTYAGSGGGSNRHTPKLAFLLPAVPGPSPQEVVLFSGVSIPGVCRVLTEKCHKNGKWSYTTWEVKVADGVEAWTNRGGQVSALGGEGAPKEKTSWLVATWDAVTVPTGVFRALCPTHAGRLDENDKPV